MANGKTSAKVKAAINLGIWYQAKDEWRKNSPVAKKFATWGVLQSKMKNAGDLIQVKSPAFAFYN